MGILNFLTRIDRRLIFIVVALGVTLPLLFKIILPVSPTREVEMAYQEIEKLPWGSKLLVSIDYDAASMPELQPMLYSVLHQAFRKNLKVVMMGHWPLGLPLGLLALEEMAREYKKIYGEDYVFLGYRPGREAVMINLGRGFKGVFASDYFGTLLDSLPIMQETKNYNDIDLLVTLAAGRDSEYWVQFARARYNVKIVIGGTAVMIAELFRYLQSGQILGLIGGLRGAADYETLTRIPGSASVGMTAQSVVHILILAFILVGNIAFFITRRKQK